MAATIDSDSYGACGSEPKTVSRGEEEAPQLTAKLDSALEHSDVSVFEDLIKRHGKTAASQMLLELRSLSVIHVAAANGCVQLLQLFSELPDFADLNRYSLRYEGTPLSVAVSNGQAETVRYLLEHKAQQESPIIKNSSMEVAIKQGNHAVVGILADNLKTLESNTSWRGFVVFLCCEHGQYAMLKHYWEDTVEVTKEVYTEMVLSLELTMSEVKDWSPSDRFLQLLLLAAFKGLESQPPPTPTELKKSYHKIIRFLFGQGAFIDQVVVSYSSTEVLKYLNAKNSVEQGAKGVKVVIANWASKRLSFIDYQLWLLPSAGVIVELNVSRNSLKQLPPEVPWKLLALERFIMNDCNNLSKFPRPLQGVSCVMLTKLVVSGNKRLETIPEELFQLPNLRSVDLSSNNLKTIAEDSSSSCSCSSLETLNLSTNGLVLIHSSFLAGATSLRHLLLADNKLESFPQPWSCPLTKLDIKHNMLSSLPENLDSFWKHSLQLLDASDNKLSTIPLCVGTLRALIHLDLSHNQLEELPSPEKWTCSRLQTLNLAHNRLGSAQQKNFDRYKVRLRYMSSLSSVKLSPIKSSPPSPQQVESGNSLIPEIAFPTVFAEHICSVNLSSNQLCKLPLAICSLSTLCELDLRQNLNLIDLPCELARLQGLEILNVFDLDLTGLNHLNPKKNLKVRTSDIMTYLRSKLRNEQPYNQMKVLVVGKEGSGKSAVIRNLMGIGHAPKAKASTSSCPLQIHKWKMDSTNMKKGPVKKLTLSIWELTGGNSYHAVHQCFMTDDALYIVVFPLTARAFDVNTWLLTIRARSPKSSVFVIGTHLELFQKQHSDWKRKLEALSDQISDIQYRISDCPTIVHFIPVSNENGENITSLKVKLYNYCQEKLRDMMVPRSYLELRTRIEEEAATQNTPWLTQEQFLGLIPSNSDILKDDKDEELAKVTQIFHRSGVLLHHFKNMRVLETEFWILEPIWLCDQLCRVVVQKDSKRKLTMDTIEGLLKQGQNSLSEDSAAVVQYLVELMRRFELVLFLKGETKLLIPNKLPREPPEIEFEFKGPVLCRVYRMSCTPPGFWSRLLVRLLMRLRDCVPQLDARRKASRAYHLQCSAGVLNKNVGILRHKRKKFGGELRRKAWQTFYWAEGCVSQYDGGYLRVESLKDSPISEFLQGDALKYADGIVVLTCGEKPALTSLDFSYFSLAIDELDVLISEWFPEYDFGEGRIQRFAICPHCLNQVWSHQHSATNSIHHSPQQQQLFISSFHLEMVALEMRKAMDISCPFHEDELVSLESIIPDLLLRDIPEVPTIRRQHLKKRQFLARGGQASIYTGFYKNQTVALKIFFEERQMTGGSVDDQEETSSPDSFPTLRLFNNYLTAVERPQLDTSRFQQCVRNSTINSALSPNEELELLVLYGYQSMRKEVMFLSALNHPNIIKILGLMMAPQAPLAVALEFAHLGNLYNFLSTQRQESETFQRSISEIGIHHGCLLNRLLTYKIAWQIVVALGYLHKEGILYRDLKASNVLLFDIDLDAKINVKLSDYGISSYLTPHGTIGTEGSPGFQAPEVLRNMLYDDKADLFSYGMVVYELFTGLSPFHDLSFVDEIARAVKRCKRPSLREAQVSPDFCELVSLMEQCWEATPTQRPTASQARQLLEDVFFFISKNTITLKPEKEHTFFDFVSVPMDACCLSSTEDLRNTQRFIHPVSTVMADHLWIFSGHQSDRSFGILELQRHSNGYESMPCTGGEIVALANVANYAIAVTTSTSFVSQGVGPINGSHASFFHPVEVLTFDSEGKQLSCISYLECGSMHGQPRTICAVPYSTNGNRFLVALGTGDGSMLLFEWDPLSPRDWRLLKLLQLCSHTRNVNAVASNEACQEMMIACGSVVYCVSTRSLLVEHTISNKTRDDIMYIASATSTVLFSDEFLITVVDNRCPHNVLCLLDPISRPPLEQLSIKLEPCIAQIENDGDSVFLTSSPSTSTMNSGRVSLAGIPNSASNSNLILNSNRQRFRAASFTDSSSSIRSCVVPSICGILLAQDILWVARKDGHLLLVDFNRDHDEFGTIVAVSKLQGQHKPKALFLTENAVCLLTRAELINDTTPNQGGNELSTENGRPRSSSHRPRTSTSTPVLTQQVRTRKSVMSYCGPTSPFIPAVATVVDEKIHLYEIIKTSDVQRLRQMWQDLREEEIRCAQ